MLEYDGYLRDANEIAALLSSPDGAEYADPDQVLRAGKIAVGSLSHLEAEGELWRYIEKLS